MKTIEDCAIFGRSGPVEPEELRRCGCERCQQELLERGAWRAMFGDDLVFPLDEEERDDDDA